MAPSVRLEMINQRSGDCFAKRPASGPTDPAVAHTPPIRRFTALFWRFDQKKKIRFFNNLSPRAWWRGEGLSVILRFFISLIGREAPPFYFGMNSSGQSCFYIGRFKKKKRKKEKRKWDVRNKRQMFQQWNGIVLPTLKLISFSAKYTLPSALLIERTIPSTDLSLSFLINQNLVYMYIY